MTADVDWHAVLEAVRRAGSQADQPTRLTGRARTSFARICRTVSRPHVSRSRAVKDSLRLWGTPSKEALGARCRPERVGRGKPIRLVAASPKVAQRRNAPRKRASLPQSEPSRRKRDTRTPAPFRRRVRSATDGWRKWSFGSQLRSKVADDSPDAKRSWPCSVAARTPRSSLTRLAAHPFGRALTGPAAATSAP
jgi:hypothetical protein